MALRIRGVGVDAPVIKVGQEKDGTISTPTAAQARSAAWYTGSSAPGQAGPAVIVGHVDSHLVPNKKAAFYYLGSVRPGYEIDVERADHMIAQFTVDSVEVARKDKFPAAKVYGPTGYAGLRLITCGGSWTKKASYDSNVIVFAHMTGFRHK